MDADAAVGFDSLSNTALAFTLVVGFLAGVLGRGGAFFALASDAAVGAYNPDEGVFGLDIIPAGVFARTGVEVAVCPIRERARTVDTFDVVDWPVSCAFRGFVTGGDLLGVVGPFGVALSVALRVGTGDFTGAVVDADADDDDVLARLLIGSFPEERGFTGVSATVVARGGGGTCVLFCVVGDIGGSTFFKIASGADDNTEVVSLRIACASGNVPALSIEFLATGDRTDPSLEPFSVTSDFPLSVNEVVDACVVALDVGTISGTFATAVATLRGGHSLFSFTSSFAESPVIWLIILEGRLFVPVPAFDARFDCCSKRPMRLATLWRGRSSGKGLKPWKC